MDTKEQVKSNDATAHVAVQLAGSTAPDATATPQWEASILGAHYLNGSRSDMYAGVHQYSEDFVECHIWTPGCGFSPMKSHHTSLAEAKKHAEEGLCRIDLKFAQKFKQAKVGEAA